MKRNVLLAAALFAALTVIGLLGQPAAAYGQEGAVLAGAWYWENNLDIFFTGAVLPSLLTFHNDGTVSGSDALSFGGTPSNLLRVTPLYGVWERVGPHEFRATLLGLLFDTTKMNVLVGVMRSRATFHFEGDFDHFAGTMHLDVLPCPASPYGFLMCPNPLLAQESDWQAWPGISDLSFKAARLSVVPY